MARLFDDALDEELQLDAAVVSGEPFTMACWVNKNDTAVAGCAMSIADKDVADDQHRLFYNDDESVGASSFDGTLSEATSVTTGGVDTWEHICGVWEATNNRRAYLNGGGEGTNADSRTVVNLDSFAIGTTADSTPRDYWSGLIAEAAIWDVALTVPEIAALAAGLLPSMIRRESLQGYWPLYAFTGIAPDLSGNGNSLTDVNTVLTGNHAPVIPYSRRFWAAGGPLIEVAAAPSGFTLRSYPRGANRGILRGVA